MIGISADGSVTVTGSGSTWTTTGGLTVGHVGKGTLTIEAGGTVSSTADTYIGHYGGSEGTVTVTGAGSTLSYSGILEVGSSGAGMLTIEAGGTVSSTGGDTFIGVADGGEGTVTVTGAGSTWSNTGTVYVGNDGVGTLTIEAGGTVKAWRAQVTNQGTGTLRLLGDATGRGVLETGQVMKGDGTATLELNGGILRAMAAQPNYLSGFPAQTLGANGVFFDSNGYNIGFSTALGGTGGLTKLGAGTLTLRGTNSYTGATTVSAGTLVAGSDQALGSSAGGTSVASGASLSLANGVTIADGLAIAGNGVSSGGALQVATGSATVSGNVGLTGDSLINIANGATLTINGALSGNYTLSRSVGGGTLVLNGNNSAAPTSLYIGEGALVITDQTNLTAGSLTLNTGNTETAGLRVTGSDVTLTKNITLGFSGGRITNDNTLTLSGVLSGGSISSNGRILTKAGTGKLILTGNNTYTGSATGSGTTVLGGTLSITSGNNLGGGPVVLNGGGLEITGSNASLDHKIGLLSNASIAVTDSATLSGVVSDLGKLTKDGDGTLTLTGANTYAGGTVINAGTLALGAGGSLAATGSVTLANAGAGFDISSAGANQTIGALSGVAGSTVALGANTLTSTNITAQSFGGSIAGTGGLTKEGSATLTLTGANTYTGTTTIDNGTLALGAGGSLAANSAVNISGAGAAFDISGAGANQTIGALFGRTDSIVSLGANTLTFGDATDQTFRGDISGTGGLVKQGSGTQILNGYNYNYTGAIAVNAGTLRVESWLSSASVTVASGATLGGSSTITGAVTVLDGGILAPGSSPGTLTVGSLVLNDTSRLSYELGTPNVVGGGVNDLVSVNGNLTLDGVLDITAQSGFGGGTYRLFDYGGALTDNGLVFGIVPTGYDFSVDATGGQVNLTTTTATLQFWNGANTSADGTIHGGSGTWNAGSTNWTNASGSIASAWGDLTAVFAGPAGGTVTIATDQQIAGLQFGTDGYVLNGPGALLISNAATEMRVDTGISATINAAIAGTGGLTKTGGGTIVLGGTNTYFGGTTINAGTLSISSDENLGNVASSLTFNGGTLATTATIAMTRPVMLAGSGSIDVAASTQLTLGGDVFGTGGLTKLGGGTLVLSAANAHSGGTTISAGVLRADNVTALGIGALTLDGGTFRTGVSANSEFANAVKINATGGTIDSDSRFVVFMGDITDGSGTGGALAFVNSTGGSSTTGLGGTNTYSGATSVGAGVVLKAHSDGGFSPNSDMTVEAGGMLGVNGHAATVRSLSGAGTVLNLSITTAGSLTIAPPSGTTTFSGTIFDGPSSGTVIPLALVKAGAGTQILTGENSYTGGTTISGGTLQIGAGGTTGSIVGDVVNNGTLAFDRSDNVTFTGAISGSGSLAHLSAGGLILTGANSFTGGTTIASGTLQIGNGGTTGSLTGDVVNEGRLAFDRSDAITFTGAISGSGSLAKFGAGTLTLTGTNNYSGGTKIVAGTLIGSAASLGSSTILNDGALVIDQATLASFANPINGTGSFTKQGAGDLKLTGTSGLTGATTVAAGRLSVNGSLASSAVTVLAGAELGGNGAVGATTVQSGGTIAPGNSIGTLTVNGDLVLAPGSVFAAEVGGDGTSDRIVVTGQATLTGSTVTIAAIDPQTSYQPGQRYALVSAAGGVNGGFAAVTSTSAFLDLGLDPRTGEAGVSIKVKPGEAQPGATPIIFQTVAQTGNQYAAALGLNTLPQVGGTLALYNSLLMLDAASARQAFDLLSGEIHASAKTALVEEGGALRSTAIDRLRSAFGTVGSAPMATMSYGFTADLAPAVKGPMPVPRTDRFAVWGQGYGSWGRSDAQAGIAKLNRSTGGLMIGGDVAVLDTLRFGLLAGYSHSEFDVKGRLSSGESDNYHLGVYGGGQWGALGLRTGASYTWHDVSTRRTATFAGFGDGLQSDYNAGTAQVFGELGYRFDLGRTSFEPFAGLAYVNLHTDGFREIGGAAALSGRSDDTSIGYSTLGLRASTSFALSGMDLTLRGALAWRRAFGDVDPAATLAFSGSNVFTVAGVPIAKNAALVEAGLDFAISRSAMLGISYTGQLSTDAQDHAFKANLAVKF